MNNAPPPVVRRARLLHQLDAALKSGHVLITAPPGYGKTTLLRLLAGQRPDTYYFQLTLPDADVSQLRAHLHAVVRPGSTLLLDDVDVLQAAAEALHWLVERARTTPLRLVLSGRQMPLTAGALDSPGTVAIYTERDLAFTVAESQALFTASGPDEAGLAAWHERTQGWPLALALAARDPMGRARLDLTQHPTEPPAALFDYLAGTLVEGLTPALQRFMALTAVPQRFNDELAAVLLGVDQPQATAARTELLRRNLFLSEADAHPGGWFRYHDLIRAFMLARLPQLGEDPAARFGQVADWFAARGDLPLAIEHALAGRLPGLAARLLARLPLEFVRNEGRHRTFQRWITSLDQPTLAANPLLLERLGYDLLDIGQFDEARQYLDRALQLAEAQPDPLVLHRVRLSLAKAHSIVGQAQSAVDLCRLVVQAPALPPELRRQALNTTGNALAQLSQFRQARRAYLQALEIDEQAGSLPNTFYRANLVAVVLVPLGDFEMAWQLLRQDSPYFAEKAGGRSFYWLAWCGLHEALGEWEALEHDLEHLVAADAQAEQADAHDVWTPWFQALLHTGRGRLAAAHLALQRAEAVVSSNPEELLCVALARAWRLRRAGEFTAAVQAAEAALAEPWAAPLYRALLALERDLAWLSLPADSSSAAPVAALHPETTNLARLRARPQILRLRALLAVRCWRAHDPRWRRHAAAVLRALARPGYAGLLTRRDPELAAHFWVMCVQADVALPQALAALRDLGDLDAVRPLLAQGDPGVRSRAAQALAAMGHETAMPLLASTLAAERNAAVAAALTAALETLEQMPPPPLTVQLMGAFTVRRGEQVVEPGDWPRPAVRRLFQYLALHPGEQLTRDQILEDLWAGADPAAARSSFNQHISWLRRLLEPYMRPRAASRYLTVEEDRYCFAPPPVQAVVQVDVAGFEAAVRPVLAAARRQEVPPLPPALLAALAGWQPLLPEAPYDGWTQAPREGLLSLYLDGCLYVAQSLLDLGRPAEAGAWAARVIAAGPWLEDGYQAMMRALARQGHRSHALKVYAEGVAALERELGAAPSALTQWLARRLQQGEEI